MLNKDYANYQQQKTDYEKKLKQYNSDYAAWKTYMQNPDFVSGQTDWTKDELTTFLSGDGANVTYINSSKNIKLNMGNLKPVSQAEFNTVKAASYSKNIIQTMATPSTDKYVMVKLTKGSYFKYTNAVVNTKTGHNVDIKFTANNIVDKTDNKLAHYVVIDKTDMGVDQLQPIKSVAWGLDFYKTGTNTAENMDPLVGLGDIDGKQYAKVTGSDSMIYGKNLTKGANGLVTSSDETVDPDNTHNQAWYLLKNVTHMDYTYGTNDNPNSITRWSDDYWTIGNIDFAMKLKTPPVKPTAPKVPTKPVEPKKPIAPQEPKKPTEPKKPVEPKAPTKPTAPTAPVKKVEKASYTLTKLVVNEIKQFNAKFIEKTD
ncbi:hypothetical protein EFN43_02165 [Pediococcus pentosaceus]|uniref:hypothetical protein n=1 Tax=Pediococcus pentosaceus TaxID=1255 RepID=UPI0021A6F922|nr:hypothetical protein [Pediococcus pentosaceus]MCT3019892.1 hypothetical protein [Pediococcus pentosaceus]